VLAARGAGGYDAGVICFSVNSGSNGNCIYVESGGAGLLVDAGVSGKRTAERLAENGRDVRDVRAVVITHDHADHIRCAGILHRKFGLPVVMTRQTWRAGRRSCALGEIADVRFFEPGEALHFGPLTVRTVLTPHDAVEPVLLAIDAAGKRLGVLTDLGCVFDGLAEVIATLDAAFLESNYDPEMLATGPYPTAVKRRIAGDGGHLSNAEAAELMASAGGPGGAKLQWVALSHLSAVNNTPELAVDTHARIAGRRRPIHVAGRDGPGRVLKIE